VEWLPSLILLAGMAVFIVGLSALRLRLPRLRGRSALLICLIVVVFALVMTPFILLAFSGWGVGGWR
jgi:hypothetical protein